MPAYLISLCKNITERKRLEDYWANVAPAFKDVNAQAARGLYNIRNS